MYPGRQAQRGWLDGVSLKVICAAYSYSCSVSTPAPHELPNNGRATTAMQDVPRQPVPHKDIGDWWTLYDFGLEEVKSWAPGHDPRYPEVVLEDKIKAEKDSRRQDKRAARAALAEKLRNRATAAPSTATPNGASAAAEPVSGAEIEAQTTQGGPIKNTPVAFLFPGQGSQAVGMLGKTKDVPAVAAMLEKGKERPPSQRPPTQLELLVGCGTHRDCARSLAFTTAPLWLVA